MIAVVLIITATIMYYSWILIGADASETQESLFRFRPVRVKHFHMMAAQLVQTAGRVRYGLAQILPNHAPL